MEYGELEKEIILALFSLDLERETGNKKIQWHILFTWLNENQDLRQLSYDKYLASCLK